MHQVPPAIHHLPRPRRVQRGVVRRQRDREAVEFGGKRGGGTAQARRQGEQDLVPPERQLPRRCLVG